MRIFGMDFGKKKEKPETGFSSGNISSETRFIAGDMSPETEAKLIAHYLGKKFKTEFTFRIRLDGYIDEPEYQLMLSDSGSVKWPTTAHYIYGDKTDNIFNLYSEFCKAYWRNVKRATDTLDDSALDEWDKNVLKSYRKTAVASSKDEMFLRATAEGLI